MICISYNGLAALGGRSLINNLNCLFGSAVCALEKIATFLMVSSLFIGTTGFFQTYIGYAILGMTPNIIACFAIFLVTFSTYSMNKLTDFKEDSINMPERLSFLAGRKNLILGISLFAYFLASALIFYERPYALPVIFIPIIANAVYSVRILPGIPRLKDIPVMKSLVVAVSWTMVCILLPAMDMKSPTLEAIAPAFYFMLIKVFINAVLYDVRDVKGDRETGVTTMPVLLGPKKTLIVLLLMNAALIPYIAYAGRITTIVAVMIIYGFAYIIYFKERRNPFALDFFVDGQWMLASLPILI